MEFEKLATGFGMTEGPRVDEQNRLYFSDAYNGGVYRRNPDGRIETLIADRTHVGGMAFAESGGLIMTGPSVAHWDERTGAIRDLLTEFDGKRITRFNDMTVDPRGSILAGSLLWDPGPGKQRVPGALYRIDPPGKATLLWEPIQINNGLGFSPDGKLLYHADSMTRSLGVRRHRGWRRQGSAAVCQDAQGRSRRARDRCRRQRSGRGTDGR